MSDGQVDLFGDVSDVDNGARSEFDFYETPECLTWSLLHYVPEIVGARVLECCSGRGAIASVLRAVGCTVYTNDLDARQDAHTHCDATQLGYWLTLAPSVDWVITNPPFMQAFEIVQNATATGGVHVGVSMLLRKTWKEPTEDRGLWLSEHVPTREVGEPRVSFRGKGGDSCACDWMIWDRDGVTRRSAIDYLAKTRTQQR